MILDFNGLGLIKRDEKWEMRFAELLELKLTYQHYNFSGHNESKQLANWVQKQRQLKKAGQLHPERIRLIEGVGFSWDSSRAIELGK